MKPAYALGALTVLFAVLTIWSGAPDTQARWMLKAFLSGIVALFFAWRKDTE